MKCPECGKEVSYEGMFFYTSEDPDQCPELAFFLCTDKTCGWWWPAAAHWIPCKPPVEDSDG